MKEKNIQTSITNYQKNHGIEFPIGGYEVKIVKGKSFAFSQLAEHQVENLLKVKSRSNEPTVGGLAYKIPDIGLAQKPFDMMVTKGVAYVLICFWEPRKKKNLYFVDIDALLNAQHSTIKKSLKEFEVADIADKVLDLNKKKVKDLTMQASINAIDLPSEAERLEEAEPMDNEAVNL